MHPYNLNPRPDSLQYLQIAENLLKNHNLIGTKSYVLKAQESDPNSKSADQILAIVNTLVAGDKQISGNTLDWYSILQLAPRTRDSEIIASHYKRLEILLNPNQNKYAHAERAYKLVTEAYSVLSNPSRKFQFDNEYGNSKATHFNFIQTRFEGSQMQQNNELIGGGSDGTSAHFEGLEMHQGWNQLIGGSSEGSSGHFEGLEMQQGRNQQIGGGSDGSRGHFKGTEMQQGRNMQIGGSSVHFDFMQDASGRELHQTAPVQFVQQQQEVFGQQAIPQKDGQISTSQLHCSNQGKQPQPLVRPQGQPQLVRPQAQQQLVRPQPQQPLLRPQQSQPRILQPQPHQPTHWAQSDPHSQLNKPQTGSREQSTRPLHWAQHVPQQLPPLSQPQTHSWMQQALPRPHIQQTLIKPRPPPESREQSRQPLGSSQQVPWLPLESREQPQQPLHSPQWVPWHLPQSQEEPQQPLCSSQLVPQVPPLPQPQPWMQESLPSPQIQTPSPEPQSQPEKTPPVSGERVNNGEHFNFGENGDNANTHDNDVSLEEPASFWTACPYCYYMYEYAGIYEECTLRCQNCRKAFHAARIEAPPAVTDGEDAYSCWGSFPFGVSMSYLDKRKAEASNWQPFSKMYAVPRGGNTSASPQGGTECALPQAGNTSKPRNTKNSGPRIYIDDEEEDIFDDMSPNDESKDDEDWCYPPKKKKARRYTRKGSTAKTVKQHK
ncbi:hypothetical protein POM88_023993 [Heracleum sosnowskyi]|uniref:J domain-containing protein n=1 Tax=Heracleum sosnowskyi TaxID=360622 RepID=A0AAD8IJC9_9APIA|nr:hypothetical protein POM88_023993 [Heracleum sosnowskyi]